MLKHAAINSTPSDIEDDTQQEQIEMKTISDNNNIANTNTTEEPKKELDDIKMLNTEIKVFERYAKNYVGQIASSYTLPEADKWCKNKTDVSGLEPTDVSYLYQSAILHNRIPEKKSNDIISCCEIRKIDENYSFEIMLVGQSELGSNKKVAVIEAMVVDCLKAVNPNHESIPEAAHRYYDDFQMLTFKFKQEPTELKKVITKLTDRVNAITALNHIPKTEDLHAPISRTLAQQIATIYPETKFFIELRNEGLFICCNDQNVLNTFVTAMQDAKGIVPKLHLAEEKIAIEDYKDCTFAVCFKHADVAELLSLAYDKNELNLKSFIDVMYERKNLNYTEYCWQELKQARPNNQSVEMELDTKAGMSTDKKLFLIETSIHITSAANSAMEEKQLPISIKIQIKGNDNTIIYQCEAQLLKPTLNSWNKQILAINLKDVPALKTKKPLKISITCAYNNQSIDTILSNVDPRKEDKALTEAYNNKTMPLQKLTH